MEDETGIGSHAGFDEPPSPKAAGIGVAKGCSEIETQNGLLGGFGNFFSLWFKFGVQPGFQIFIMGNVFLIPLQSTE
jgi:hypothetical protein